MINIAPTILCSVDKITIVIHCCWNRRKKECYNSMLNNDNMIVESCRQVAKMVMVEQVRL